MEGINEMLHEVMQTLFECCSVFLKCHAHPSEAGGNRRGCAQLWDYLLMAAHLLVNAVPEGTPATGGRGEPGIAPPSQQHRAGGPDGWLNCGTAWRLSL